MVAEISRGGFVFRKAEDKRFKYDVFLPTNVKIATFGITNRLHYYDKIGFYAYLNTNDRQLRWQHYRTHGSFAKKYSAKWFTNKFLF